MKRIALSLVFVVVLSGSAFAAGIKPCEELKAEIDAKLQAKGVVDYALEIVPADQVSDQKVVGSCDGGTQKIIYLTGVQRTTATATTKATTYDLAMRACQDALSDISYVLSSNDMATGLIVGRSTLEGIKSFTKMNITVERADAGVSVRVSFIPTAGTTSDGSEVAAYLKALKARIPDLEVTGIR